MTAPAPEPERIAQAARFLVDERRARAPFRAIPGAFAPRDAGEAFRAQEAFHALMAPVLGPVAGYKVALTTRVMQQMVGYGEPVPGAVFAGTVHASPATAAAADHTHLGIECELAVRLGAGLPAAGAPYTRDAVARAVSAVMPAFELVDDRDVDYSGFAASILSFIADNAWNAGVVLGEELTDWRGLDLAGARGAMSLNGEPAGEGHGRDVMGHPLDALAWLANALAARGGGLDQGMLVMTGSIIATHFVAPGDRLRFALDGVGEVSVQVI